MAGREVNRLPSPNESYYDDEINLYDLWLVLVRRRVLIIFVALAITSLAVGYSVVRTPTFEFSSAIEVAEFRDSDGERQRIEPANALTSRLQDFYIPDVVQAAAERDEWTTGVDSRALESGDLHLLLSEAPEAKSADVQELHEAIGEQVINDHEARLETVRVERQQKLDEARAEVQFLKSESRQAGKLREARLERERAQADLNALRSNLDGERQTLAAELRSTENKRDALARERALLSSKVDGITAQEQQIERQVERLEPIEARLGEPSSDESTRWRGDIAERLLASTQSLEIARRVSDLERQLLVDLPARRDELDQRIRENEVNTQNQVLKVQGLELELEQFERKAEARIEAAEDDLSAAEARLVSERSALDREVELAADQVETAERRLNAIEGTDVVYTARQSRGPVGQSAMTLSALGAVLGLMLGVFSAFIREFVENAKAHQAVQSEPLDESTDPDG